MKSLSTKFNRFAEKHCGAILVFFAILFTTLFFIPIFKDNYAAYFISANQAYMSSFTIFLNTQELMDFLSHSSNAWLVFSVSAYFIAVLHAITILILALLLMFLFRKHKKQSYISIVTAFSVLMIIYIIWIAICTKNIFSFKDTYSLHAAFYICIVSVVLLLLYPLSRFIASRPPRAPRPPKPRTLTADERIATLEAEVERLKGGGV
ncbi:MAG: hypothetical protein LBT55_01750 [Clostridiaceae bacterium]|jgi:heme A synthase|nr:hypothetical protein [Clostridiaceae bacterium]